MRIVGDPEGIAALKQMLAEHREYLKFLLGEAGSNSNHAAGFRDRDGVLWQLIHHPESGELEVRRPAS